MRKMYAAKIARIKVKNARKFCFGITASIAQRLSIGKETSTAAMNVAQIKSSAKSFLCGEKYERKTLIGRAEKSFVIKKKLLIDCDFSLRYEIAFPTFSKTEIFKNVGNIEE